MRIVASKQIISTSAAWLREILFKVHNSFWPLTPDTIHYLMHIIIEIGLFLWNKIKVRSFSMEKKSNSMSKSKSKSFNITMGNHEKKWIFQWLWELSKHQKLWHSSNTSWFWHEAELSYSDSNTWLLLSLRPRGIHVTKPVHDTTWFHSTPLTFYYVI